MGKITGKSKKIENYLFSLNNFLKILFERNLFNDSSSVPYSLQFVYIKHFWIISFNIKKWVRKPELESDQIQCWSLKIYKKSTEQNIFIIFMHDILQFSLNVSSKESHMIKAQNFEKNKFKVFKKNFSKNLSNFFIS